MSFDTNDLVKLVTKGVLESTWKRAEMAILSTPLIVKVSSIASWIQHTQLKEVEDTNVDAK